MATIVIEHSYAATATSRVMLRHPWKDVKSWNIKNGVFRYVDKHGKTHLSDIGCETGETDYSRPFLVTIQDVNGAQLAEKDGYHDQTGPVYSVQYIRAAELPFPEGFVLADELTHWTWGDTAKTMVPIEEFYQELVSLDDQEDPKYDLREALSWLRPFRNQSELMVDLEG